MSTTYGRIKYEIVQQIWKMQLLAAESDINKTPLDAEAMRTSIATYEKLWEDWKKLKADHACCPTLYRDDVAQHCPFAPFKKVLEQYKKEINSRATKT